MGKTVRQTEDSNVSERRHEEKIIEEGNLNPFWQVRNEIQEYFWEDAGFVFYL